VTREQRRLAAIVSADVAGYSRLMGRDESGTLAALKVLRQEVVDPAIASGGGRIVKTTGDGLLLEFPSVVNAVRCALEVQAAMVNRTAGMAEACRIAFRIGVNIGDVIVDGDDIFGDGVNVAARLQEIATPGGICVSSRVHEDVRDRLDIAFDDGGTQTLKNIARPVQVWRWQPEAAVPLKPASAPTTLPLPDKPSVAVLPFDNMSGDPEQAYFADGLAEDLITGLSRVSWLFVIARNSSFSLRGEKLDARTIGERLGVRYLVEGSVRRAGGRLRLTAQLIEAATSNHLWAERYDGSLEDVFDFQDRIVTSLIGAIEPKLRATEIARARLKRPDRLDAFDLYLQALPKAAALSAQSLAEAIELLDRASSLSPDYVQALAWATMCRAMRAVRGYSPDSEKDLREAGELSQRALNRDPTDPVALTAAAYVALMVRRDYQTAWDLVDRALAIDPNAAFNWGIRGWFSLWAGETEMAMTAFEKAMRLSPLDPQWGATFKGGMAGALATSGRPEEALPWARRALQENPNWPGPHLTLIAGLWLLGRHEEAREAARRHVEMFPRFSIHRYLEATPYRRTPEQQRYFFGPLREAGLPE
jgi:adenylate cyclase